MAQQWNRYNSRTNHIGGGVPVWVEIPKDVVGGGYLMNKLKQDEVLASGSPVQYDHRTHEARVLKCFKVVNVVDSEANSEISVLRTARTPQLYAGMKIMVAPKTLTGKGKAVVVTDVDESESDLYKITVVTADIATVKKDDFLVEASAVGASVAPFAIPNNLTKDDTVGGDQNTVGIPRGEKYLYENTIPAMPAVVKDHIVSVARVEWAWFPELD